MKKRIVFIFLVYFLIVEISLKEFVAPRLAARLIKKYEFDGLSTFQVEMSIIFLGAVLASVIFLSGFWAVRAINKSTKMNDAD